MEEALQIISSRYVSMDENEVPASDVTLNRIVQQLQCMISTMRRVCPLFDALFERFMYRGSFYDGLKVGHPDEFDIDLVLHLPDILNVEIIPTSQQGFVNVYLKDWSRFTKDKRLFAEYKNLHKLKDSSNYLIQENVLRWMQLLVVLALEIIILEEEMMEPFNVSFSMGGPAVTLHIQENNRIINVHLVAVFKISENKWPKSPFRAKPHGCDYFNYYYVVPKAPRSDVEYKTRCWRLSFQEQEKELLNNYYFCKHVLRLLEKLRDTRDHNIPSYFIKTICLSKVENEANFWNRPLADVFMEMLLTYKQYLDSGDIPYYWNKKDNLLQYTKTVTINNIRLFLERMINKINRESATDPYIIAKYLLTKEEYIEFKNSMSPEYCIPESARIAQEEYDKFEEQIYAFTSSKLLDSLIGIFLISCAIYMFLSIFRH